MLPIFHEKLKSCSNLEGLEILRLEYFGKQGVITEQLKLLGKLDPDKRKEEGARINALRDAVQCALMEKKQELERVALEHTLASEKLDVTLPTPVTSGTHHLITQTIAEISSYFERLSFVTKKGPDMDSEEHNFDALNIPAHHPARQSHDTFYIKDAPHTVLRTHTSTVQSRTFKECIPPFRVIAPGRVYRADYDGTHLPMFHQLEGFVVEEGINLRHLKGCLIDFCKYFFDKDDLGVRFRPSFFPFTEPSFEMDIWREGGWLEVLGCGMIHPNVLAHGNINAEHHQGFAFGLGIERFAMLKYGVRDIRSFVENDLRFAEKYSIPAALGM